MKHRCGKEILEGQKFCTGCGEKLERDVQKLSSDGNDDPTLVRDTDSTRIYTLPGGEVIFSLFIGIALLPFNFLIGALLIFFAAVMYFQGTDNRFRYHEFDRRTFTYLLLPLLYILLLGGVETFFVDEIYLLVFSYILVHLIAIPLHPPFKALNPELSTFRVKWPFFIIALSFLFIEIFYVSTYFGSILGLAVLLYTNKEEFEQLQRGHELSRSTKQQTEITSTTQQQMSVLPTSTVDTELDDLVRDYPVVGTVAEVSRRGREVQYLKEQLGRIQSEVHDNLLTTYGAQLEQFAQEENTASKHYIARQLENIRTLVRNSLETAEQLTTELARIAQETAPKTEEIDADFESTRNAIREILSDIRGSASAIDIEEEEERFRRLDHRYGQLMEEYEVAITTEIAKPLPTQSPSATPVRVELDQQQEVDFTSPFRLRSLISEKIISNLFAYVGVLLVVVGGFFGLQYLYENVIIEVFDPDVPQETALQGVALLYLSSAVLIFVPLLIVRMLSEGWAVVSRISMALGFILIQFTFYTQSVYFSVLSDELGGEALIYPGLVLFLVVAYASYYFRSQMLSLTAVGLGLYNGFIAGAEDTPSGAIILGDTLFGSSAGSYLLSMVFMAVLVYCVIMVQKHSFWLHYGIYLIFSPILWLQLSEMIAGPYVLALMLTISSIGQITLGTYLNHCICKGFPLFFQVSNMGCAMSLLYQAWIFHTILIMGV